MSNVFKVEIINPEKSFLSKEDVVEKAEKMAKDAAA